MKSDVGRYALVPEWLLDAVDNGTAIRLFAILAAKYVDRNDGTAHPSRRALASDLGGSVDTVDRAMKALVDAGAIIVTPRLDEHGDRTSNQYTLAFARPGSRQSAATPSRTDAATGGRTDAAVIQNQVDPESIEPETPPQARAREQFVAAFEYQPTKLLSEELEGIDVAHPPDCVEWAFREAASVQEPSWRYARSIFNACLLEGHGPREKRNGRSANGRAGARVGAVRKSDGRRIGASQRVPGTGVDWDEERRAADERRAVADSYRGTPGAAGDKVGRHV